MKPIERRTRPLPSDGLERVVSEGRRRRRRAVGAVGAPSAALAVVIAIVVSGSGPATDSMNVMNPDPTATSTTEAGVTESPEPTPDPVDEEPSPEPSEWSEAEDDVGPESQGTPICIDYCDGSYPEVRRATQDDHEIVQDNHGPCQLSSSTGDDEGETLSFCTFQSASTTQVRSGEAVTIVSDWCPAEPLTAKTAPQTMTWGTGQEHDLVLTAPGERGEVWHWGDDKYFLGEAHQESVEALSCVRWTTTWDGTIAGAPAAPGTYELNTEYVWKDNQRIGSDDPMFITVTE